MGKPEQIRLGEILLQQNMLTEDQRKTALEAQEHGHGDRTPLNPSNTSDCARCAEATGLRPVANGVVRPKGVA